MTDWIWHNGGPQPVADDVWVKISTPPENQVQPAAKFNWKASLFYFRILNQHLIDAARLEGIRLGLEAAAKATDIGAHWASEDLREAHNNHLRLEGRSDGLAEATDLIRNLNPDRIATATD